MYNIINTHAHTHTPILNSEAYIPRAACRVTHASEFFINGFWRYREEKKISNNNKNNK